MKLQLILLGAAGGPTPKRTRSAPAQAIRIGDEIHLVDCGNGVGRMYALAELPFGALRHVYVTHHHSDHVADLVTFPLLAWAAGLDHEIVLHGPPPLARAVRDGLSAARFDIETRAQDEGRRPLDQLIRVEEFREGGVVLQDGGVTVRAARVEHPPIADAYAYRFDTPMGSIVISGDTAPCASLVELARGAAVLVHEVLVLDPPELCAWFGKPLEDPLIRHVINSHTSYRDVGRVAQEAGVRLLLLSQFVPGDLQVDRLKVLHAIREHYLGEVVFGEDLMVVG